MIEGIIGTVMAIALIAYWLSKMNSVPVSTWALGLTKQQRAYVRAKARAKKLEPAEIYDAWARKRLAKGLYSGEFILTTLQREEDERAIERDTAPMLAPGADTEPVPVFEGAPPDDVEALVFGMAISVATIGEPDANGKMDVTFDSNCTDCGGYIITLSEPITDESAATCKACGRLFGRWVAVRALMRDVYRDHQKRVIFASSNPVI